MKYQCEYFESPFITNNENKFYCCQIRNQEIFFDEKIELIGENFKTIKDVTSVNFINCTLNKLPKCLSIIFPNLKIICIQSSSFKCLHKNDLKDHKQLMMLYCFNTEIEFVPGNLFDESESIEEINFTGNSKLKFIEPNLLDNLKVLKHFEMLNNNFVPDVKYSTLPNGTKSLPLEKVKTELTDRFFSSNSNAIDDFVSKLESPLEQLREFMKRVKSPESRIKILELTTEFAEKSLKQKLQKGLFGDLQKLINNEETKDFVIQIKNHEFKVHKFLLIVRSPRFAEILRDNPEVEKLNLNDIPVEIFKIILKFLYTDELPVEDETNFLQLFVAAGRLQIHELKNLAAKKIMENINNLNIIELIRVADKYKHEEMLQKAFQEIKMKYPEIPFKDEWMQDSERIIKIIETFEMKEKEKKRLETEFENFLK